MSHGDYSPINDGIALDDDHDDRTGLDASPVYPSSPTSPTTHALNVEGNSAFADPTEESQDSTNSIIIQKRKALLRDLLTGLDAIIYIELAALYYLDNSATFFALRSLVQLAQITSILTLSTFQLSTLINGTGTTSSSTSTSTSTAGGQVLGTNEPAPTTIPTTTTSTTPILDIGHQAPSASFMPSIPIPKPGTTGRPNILLILGLNTLCLFIHFFSDAPTASEVTRFYMHGSIIIDFIGQRAMGGWSAKARLCAMDLLVAALQVCAMGVVAELLAKKDVVKSVNVMSEGRAGERVGDAVRRFWRGWEASVGGAGRRMEGQEGDDVEMQPLRDGVRQEEEEQIPRSPLDVYSSGQAVVADLNLVETVRQQFWELRNTRLAGQV